MKQETIPERAEEALSRRLAELPVQQMPESLKLDIVRRTERTVRRRKRTGKVWRATAVAVGGAALCLLGGRTLVVLGPDLRTLLQSIAGTCIAAVQPICLRYLHLYTVLAGTAALAAFYFAVNAVLERKRRDV